MAGAALSKLEAVLLDLAGAPFAGFGIEDDVRIASLAELLALV